MKSKQNKVIRLTEEELYKIIEETTIEVLQEGKWLNRMGGLALGAASLFGGYGNAHAQDNGNVYVNGNAPVERPTQQEVNNLSNETFSNPVSLINYMGKHMVDSQSNEKVVQWLNKVGFSNFFHKYPNNVITKSNIVAHDGNFIGTSINISKAQAKYGEDFVIALYNDSNSGNSFYVILSLANFNSIMGSK